MNKIFLILCMTLYYMSYSQNLCDCYTFNSLDTTVSEVKRDYYTTFFSKKNKYSKLVVHKLNLDSVYNIAERKNRFYDDKKDSIDPLKPKEYKNTGYDRGHMAPAADFSWSQKAMDESFEMSNIVPQTPTINRKFIKNIEITFREKFINKEIYESVTIFTGVITFIEGKEHYFEEFPSIPKPMGYYKIACAKNKNKDSYNIHYYYINGQTHNYHEIELYNIKVLSSDDIETFENLLLKNQFSLN